MRTVVAIPAYSKSMKPEEVCSLRQCIRIFGGRRKIVLFVPESLDCSSYLEIAPEVEVQRFPDSFFTSISSYSRLLLTPDFYLRFKEYDYMLIYQLDGWVFRDELDLWCAKDYEYIGGPFFIQDGKKKIPVVGNGGVSLRKIKSVLRVLNGTKQKMFPNKLLWRFFRNYTVGHRYIHSLIPLLKMVNILPNSRGKYLESVRRGTLNQEDVVFYYLSREFVPDGLLMPGWEEASRFSLDAAPRKFFVDLPFCCHAWRKNDFEFWKKYIDFK